MNTTDTIGMLGCAVVLAHPMFSLLPAWLKIHKANKAYKEKENNWEKNEAKFRESILLHINYKIDSGEIILPNYDPPYVKKYIEDYVEEQITFWKKREGLIN